MLVAARAFIRADSKAEAQAIADTIPNHKLALEGPGVGGEPLPGTPDGALPLWTLSRNMIVAEACAPLDATLELDPAKERTDP